MIMVLDLLIFIFLLLVLIISGLGVTRNISTIASYLGLNQFSAGFIIIALATGIPELTVGLYSALAGVPTLSLGDIIGSNIINLSLVIGIAVMIAGAVKFQEKDIKKETMYLFLISLLPILLAVDQNLSRIDGIILIIIFVFYLLTVVNERDPDKGSEITRKEFLTSVLIFMVSLVVLLISARYLVDYSTLIALEVGVPVFIVGIFLVSFGTSIPELVFDTLALLQGYKLLAIGDLMGSTVANSTLIIGTVAIVSPFHIPNFSLFQLVSLFFIIIVFLFVVILNSKKGFDRWRALFLIALYFLFLIIIETSQLLFR